MQTLRDSTLKDGQITSLQIRTWLETKELITIQQIGSLLNGSQEYINSACTKANCLLSACQSQRPRCLPSHDRGLPPSFDKHNRRDCSACPKLCNPRRLQPAPSNQQIYQRYTRWLPAAQPEEWRSAQEEWHNQIQRKWAIELSAKSHVVRSSAGSSQHYCWQRVGQKGRGRRLWS